VADRLLFEKTGRAKYISHLDLMRTFQRAFSRAGIQIKHTEGFNPHPFVSIALPLSVGFSSQCEILEFGLVGGAEAEEVPARLTAAMPEGIRILACYPGERKLKELYSIHYVMTFEFPGGRPSGCEDAIAELLGRESILMKKKSNKAKSGFTEVDLIPLISSCEITAEEQTISFHMVVRAQNPGLNPALLAEVLPEELRPDFTAYSRQEILCEDGTVFR